MSVLDKYINKLVKGEEDTFDFPKHESSWEELFVFGEYRIKDIVSLRTTLAEREKRIEELEKQLAVAVKLKSKNAEGFDWKVLGRIFDLEEALKPFAKRADEFCFIQEGSKTLVNIQDIHNAKKVLESESK